MSDKIFHVVSKKDNNINFIVKAENIEKAALEALFQLGWCITTSKDSGRC